MSETAEEQLKHSLPNGNFFYQLQLEKIEQLIVVTENLKTRISGIENIPKSKLESYKVIIPAMAALFALVLGTLGLEITTLFFIINHIISTAH